MDKALVEEQKLVRGRLAARATLPQVLRYNTMTQQSHWLRGHLVERNILD